VTILNSFKLNNKVALVTGASRGIGRALAVGLAEAGAEIAGVSRGAHPGEIQQEVEALGRRYLHLQCDLGEAPVVRLQALVEQTVSEMGRLDILVNNAGIIRRTPALETNEADWDAVLQVNLKTAFFLAQAAAKVMLAQGGGKIINVGSVLSYQGGILVPSYTAAKHGLAGVTRALANEWAKHNINVNAIAPGYIATDATEPLQQDEQRNKAILDRIPAGRWGQPDDLKGLVVYLASAASAYMHGSILPIDGAWLAR
jgi:2-deoxy-D-gluconate 3-dehydrogenase